jgi:Ca2+/Na+ antiporter
MDALFGFLSIVAFLVGALLLIIFLIMKRRVRTPLIVMAVAFAVFIVCVSSLDVENEPELENTDNTEMTETVITSYANQSIDLNNLGQYPWGNVLHDALLSIGATDIKTVKCEVDLSTVTFKIETETNKLWASVCGKYESEWYVEWIRNYDESDIYYYVTTRNTIYEERLYSYETGEIIYEPEPGNRSKYPIIVTVEEFVDEINADIESAKDKYNGKWVEITGRVTDYSRYNSSSLSGYYLYGEYGDEGLRIVCWQNKGAELQFTKVGCMCTCTGLVREITTANATEIGDCRIVFE